MKEQPLSNNIVLWVLSQMCSSLLNHVNYTYKAFSSPNTCRHDETAQQFLQNFKPITDSHSFRPRSAASQKVLKECSFTNTNMDSFKPAVSPLLIKSYTQLSLQVVDSKTAATKSNLLSSVQTERETGGSRSFHVLRRLLDLYLMALLCSIMWLSYTHFTVIRAPPVDQESNCSQQINHQHASIFVPHPA